MERMHGKELVRTLRHHALEDVDHSLSIRTTLDLVPDEYHGLITDAAVTSAIMFREKFRTL